MSSPLPSAAGQGQAEEPNAAEVVSSPSVVPPAHEPSVRVWVEDNGIGIPKAAQEKMFRMFQRMHHATDYPGTGIGLAIVRKAAERMNGRVVVDSEPGKGSRFGVELPRPIQSQGSLQDAA